MTAPQRFDACVARRRLESGRQVCIASARRPLTRARTSMSASVILTDQLRDWNSCCALWLIVKKLTMDLLRELSRSKITRGLLELIQTRRGLTGKYSPYGQVAQYMCSCSFYQLSRVVTFTIRRIGIDSFDEVD
jgi:hypothetical protein